MACVERIKHNVEHCTSEKGLQVFYDDGKNIFTGYCFSCASRGLEAYVFDPYNGKQPKPPKRKTEDEINEEIQEIRNLKSPRDIHRGIAPEYFAKAGVKLAYSEYDGKTPFTYNFPYTIDGKLVGYKAIMLDKKAMWSIGDIKGADLFNWEIAKKSGVKRLYVTEGEFDCRALEQMLEAHAAKRKSAYNKFAVVSLPHGVGSAVHTLGRMRKEIDKFFTETVLVFDNDEAGKKAVKDVQKILPDIKVATYPTNAKDANEVLLKGDGDLFADFCIWKSAKPVTEGVVGVSTVLSRDDTPPDPGFAYPWQALTDMNCTQRMGEATCTGAGVGLGKTLLSHMKSAHNITVHKEKVFSVLLEEPNRSTLYNIAGKIDGIPYHLPSAHEMHREQYLETAYSLEGKLFLWESDGQAAANRFDIEEIVKAIRYNAMEYGVRFVEIDNMTRLVDHLTSGEANEFINKWSSELANLAAELDIHIGVYSHLNPPKGKDAKDHENGGEVFASQFTGSRGIMRAFPLLMSFERNKHAQGDLKANSFIGCIKNRMFGGEDKFKTQYQASTGLLLQYEWEGDSL
jgi:twinkle protein